MQTAIAFKNKALLKEVLIELFNERKDLVKEVFFDVIEEIGLINAIKEGEKTDYIDEREIMKTLGRENVS